VVVLIQVVVAVADMVAVIVGHPGRNTVSHYMSVDVMRY
jgi:hypothetical protein